MPALKLPKLPDRTPVKVSLTLNPELHRSLVDYSEVYRLTYGEEKPEPLTEIILAILQKFLESDREFSKTRRKDGRDSNTSRRRSSNSRGPHSAHSSQS